MRTLELILKMEATQIVRFEHGRCDVVIRYELPWDLVTFGWASTGYNDRNGHRLTLGCLCRPTRTDAA